MPSLEAARSVKPYIELLRRAEEGAANDLDRYVQLLHRWQPAQNLVSRETLAELWPRHIEDSLQTLMRLRPTDKKFLDLGSGGGFPAVPMAIILRGHSDVAFHLIEANARKASFLRSVARELALPVIVDARRIGEIDSRETLAADVITSRALARLPDLCSLAAPFFGPETRAIFHKGREFGEELAETRAIWEFDVLVFPSRTSPDGVLLEISNLRSVSKH